jgi:hypothetical protein
VVELVAEKLVERRLAVVREKEQREMSAGKKNRWGRLFFVNFWPEFLYSQSMESIPIYRG